MQIHISSVVSLLLVLGFPFIMTEVVDSFSKCEEHFFNKRPPHNLDRQCSGGEESYKMICQKYNGEYRFATLYDTQHRIPVLSGYKYTGSGGSKDIHHDLMMVEPQLEPSTDEMEGEYENQAKPRDFHKRKSVHLIPGSYAAERDIASTFTLTNSVPLDESHESTWNNMVEENKQLMDKHCSDKNSNVLAYVLAGAIPDRAADRGRRIKDPSHMWIAFCCHNDPERTWTSKAQWITNDNNQMKTTGEIQDLQEFLKSKLNVNTRLFNNDCKEPKNPIREFFRGIFGCCYC